MIYFVRPLVKADSAREKEKKAYSISSGDFKGEVGWRGTEKKKRSD